jgi:putative ATPase
MSDLWATQRAARRDAAAPLAVRMRPRTLDDVVGQPTLLGAGSLLRRMLDADRLTSVIFAGPPGTGKTTLAEVIARDTGRHFERANAALIGVKEIRKVLDEATARREYDDHGTILFLDEIHRFARNQQDVLLNSVELGLITLIGATTENPTFALNSALNSRSTIFRLEPLEEADVLTLLRRALTDERGFADLDIAVDDAALTHWARLCDGDARRALTALEVAVLSQTDAGDNGRIAIDLACAEASIQGKAVVYDGTGDEHYDVASAFIKSMRGGDADAAVYWLARMLEAGEDPRFIARRIAILASEDVGNADPAALGVAAAAWEITERVGMPECRHTLAHAAIYMACAPKSRACTDAIGAATEDVREGRTVPVPRRLRDPRSLGARGECVEADDGSYLGVERTYYRPGKMGFEDQIRRRLEQEDGGRERESGGEVSDE